MSKHSKKSVHIAASHTQNTGHPKARRAKWTANLLHATPEGTSSRTFDGQLDADHPAPATLFIESIIESVIKQQPLRVTAITITLELLPDPPSSDFLPN